VPGAARQFFDYAHKETRVWAEKQQFNSVNAGVRLYEPGAALRFVSNRVVFRR